jgi:hypothetical protein
MTKASLRRAQEPHAGGVLAALLVVYLAYDLNIFTTAAPSVTFRLAFRSCLAMALNMRLRRIGLVL